MGFNDYEQRKTEYKNKYHSNDTTIDPYLVPPNEKLDIKLQKWIEKIKRSIKEDKDWRGD